MAQASRSPNWPILRFMSTKPKLEHANWRGHIAPLLVCILFCIFMSILPHLVWWAQTGQPVWIADQDDAMNLALSANAYHNHPAYLSDILRPSGGDCIYPNLQFIPFVVMAKLFRLPPVYISLLWRVWAGIALSGSLYLLLNLFLRRPWFAAAITVLLLFDFGFAFANIGVRHFTVLLNFLTGNGQAYLDGNSQFTQPWRVMSPAVTLPFVFLHLWFQFRARSAPTTVRILLAGASFGLLFYVYLYYWTAVGLGLILSAFLDRGHRRTHLLTAVIGSLIGLPSVAYGYVVAHRNPTDWGIRSDFLRRIPHFSQLGLPKVGLILLPLSFIWVWRYRRDLVPLWALAASGLLLAHHQIITGLQMQNLHWGYVWGPVLSVVVMLCVAGEAARHDRIKRIAVPVLIGLCALMIGSGAWMRALAAIHTPVSIDYTLSYQRYRIQRLTDPARELSPNVVIAGDRRLVDAAVILDNVRPLDHFILIPTISLTDSEMDERKALNSILLGQDRSEFERRQREELSSWPFGPAAFSREAFESTIARRLATYDVIVVDPRMSWEKFDVRYVGFPVDGSPASVLVNNGWRRIQPGPTWQIWERTR